MWYQKRYPQNGFCSELITILNAITTNRLAVYRSTKELELQGFADASQKAYQACVYRIFQKMIEIFLG